MSDEDEKARNERLQLGLWFIYENRHRISFDFSTLSELLLSQLKNIYIIYIY